MTTALKLIDLNVRRGPTTVVQGFSVNIEEATWLGVIGANGSGKTTLLRAVAGRLPIASGRCIVNGRDLASDRAARARTVGFAPPIERLPSSLTVGELLELAGDPQAEQACRNEQLWSALGIKRLVDRTIGQCSSGMRQRAAIALAFASPAAIVILDEPFNWLDPVAAFDTREALDHKVRVGTTIITALHDLPTLCGVCDAGIVMAHGVRTLELGREMLRSGSRDIQNFERIMIEALR